MQKNNLLPKEGLVRLSTILQVVPVAKSTWWAGVKSGRYPQPVRHLGPKTTAWKVSEIRALIEQEGNTHDSDTGHAAKSIASN